MTDAKTKRRVNELFRELRSLMETEPDLYQRMLESHQKVPSWSDGRYLALPMQVHAEVVELALNLFCATAAFCPEWRKFDQQEGAAFLIHHAARIGIELMALEIEQHWRKIGFVPPGGDNWRKYIANELDAHHKARKAQP